MKSKFQVGDRIQISHNPILDWYSGKRGTVTGVGKGSTYQVRLDANDEELHFSEANLEDLDQSP